MKKIFLMAMSAVLACVACDKDNYNYGGIEEGYGVLSFADAGFVVSEEVETRADAAKNNTCIWVLKKGETENEIVDINPNSEDDYVTYSSVKEKGITLPGGNYILRAQTEYEIPKAGTDPVYGIEKEFTITAGERTELGELTLTLYKQVKVNVYYNETFRNSLTANGGTTKVTIDGTNELTFDVTPTNYQSDPKYLYLELTEATKETGVTMEIMVNAEMNVKEGNVTSVKTQKMSATITGVKPCQYSQININKEEIKDGGANFTIVVDGLEVDTELTTDVEASEESLGADPNAPKGDGGIKLLNTAGLSASTTPTLDAWNGSFTDDEMDVETRPGEIVITKDMTQLQFKAVVPGNILQFKVMIISDMIEPALGVAGITDPELDLINEADQVKGIAAIIPFPYHAPAEGMIVQGANELEFVLDGAIPILQEFFGEDNTTTHHSHTFQMFVQDQTGKSKTIDLALKIMNPNL